MKLIRPSEGKPIAIHHPVVYPRLVRGRPVREDQSRNGVRVIVHRNENGSTVEADCACMGGEMRLHSNPECPNLKRGGLR